MNNINTYTKIISGIVITGVVVVGGIFYYEGTDTVAPDEVELQIEDTCKSLEALRIIPGTSVRVLPEDAFTLNDVQSEIDYITDMSDWLVADHYSMTKTEMLNELNDLKIKVEEKLNELPDCEGGRISDAE